MASMPLLEVAVESVEAALVAEANGAGRIELCADLLEGGTTPSLGTIALAVERLKGPVMVMIRPRGGDFTYSDIEFEIIRRDVAAIKSLGAAGIVLGFLTEDGAVDVIRTREIVELAAPMQVTFHRAFDWTRDPFAAFDAIAAIPGITRILTSGQQKSALEGLPLIIELMKRARPTHGNPTPPLILPGGDINARTLPMIQHFISLDPSAPRLAEVHASASSTMVVPGYRNSAVSFAPLVKGSDGTRSVGDGAKVAGLVRILGAAGAPS